MRLNSSNVKLERVLSTLAYRSLPALERPSHGARLMVEASSLDLINPAAANALAGLGPSKSITGRALFDVIRPSASMLRQSQWLPSRTGNSVLRLKTRPSFSTA